MAERAYCVVRKIDSKDLRQAYRCINFLLNDIPCDMCYWFKEECNRKGNVEYWKE